MIDAEESIGDGFSFSGGDLGNSGLYQPGSIRIDCYCYIFLVFFLLIVTGKYGEGPSKSDEWFAQGKMVCTTFCFSFFE